MRSIILSILAFIACFQGTTFAQMGMNSISIATTSEGNMIWNANVEGCNRKGYFEKNFASEGCSQQAVEKDVLVPVTADLYPGQSTHMLFFEGTGYDNFTVTIKDAAGKTMATETYSDHTSIDISSFDNGTYTVQIVAEKTGQVSVKKLIKN